MIFMSRRRKMFHGSRGIGGGPFTPRRRCGVASRRVVIAYPFVLRRTRKREYAAGDRASVESTYRHVGRYREKRNVIISIRAFHYATRSRSRSPWGSGRINRSRREYFLRYSARYAAVCTCINDKIQIGRTWKAKGKIFLLHYRWSFKATHGSKDSAVHVDTIEVLSFSESSAVSATHLYRRGYSRCRGSYWPSRLITTGTFVHSLLHSTVYINGARASWLHLSINHNLPRGR